MIHDGKLNIATAFGAKSKVWKNKAWKWSDFAAKLREGQKTNETYKEFISASKEEQSKIKDVGGYVGGYLRGGKRSPSTVVSRQLATLDIDFAHLEFWEDFTMLFNCAAIIHGTHKHSDLTPRYRLLIPLSREATPDEYVAVSRKIAGVLGIELFDNTTFETNRLMFWASSPKDVDYYFEEQDGPWLDVDETLASYIDWKDTSLWPTADRKIRELGEASNKQEDPTEKKGIIGAFCRTYTISQAIEAFLTEEYIATADDKRYTYTKGSTAAGLMVYEDMFAYSHHGTDPCGGKLSNSFDLVRLHKFGHLDNEANTSARPKSFVAMEDFSREDAGVKATLIAEMFETSDYDYADDVPNVEGDQEDTTWAEALEVDGKGKPLSSARNITVIFANDPRLKDTFKRNQFDTKRYVFRTLPWRKISTPEPIKDVDYSGVRNYIETIYGISGSLKIDDSLAIEFEKQSFHPIKDYLNSLEWDGTKRIDNLLTDYFGALESLYTQEVVRKFMVASVKRVFVPGCKYDNVLTLVGAEGTKKSSFFKILGKVWFSDTFMTVQGKEALEQIQGAWIIEMAELAGLRKAEVEAVKHFITKQEDSFRPAYARTSETYKRQCVFVGSTNERNFLTGANGNRRFLPIEVIPERVKKDVWTDLVGEVDQLWAEAVQLFKAGETLFLSSAAEALAKRKQIEHSESDERKGLLELYLETRLPLQWLEMDIYQRRMHLEGSPNKGNLRQVVCIAEIWAECFGKNIEDMDRYKTRDINELMKSVEGWTYKATTKNFGTYGKQKYYSREEL
jgi:predicted P-loop ATPase